VRRRPLAAPFGCWLTRPSPRRLVERKKAELREMVGDRYRDLIDAADTIVTMARSSAEVMGAVAGMQSLCAAASSGQHLVSHRPASSKGSSGSDSGKAPVLYVVGMQIKLLLDAPERVCFTRFVTLPLSSSFINKRDFLCVCFVALLLAVGGFGGASIL
jgi:hypothetical protein